MPDSRQSKQKNHLPIARLKTPERWQQRKLQNVSAVFLLVNTPPGAKPFSLPSPHSANKIKEKCKNSRKALLHCCMHESTLTHQFLFLPVAHSANGNQVNGEDTIQCVRRRRHTDTASPEKKVCRLDTQDHNRGRRYGVAANKKWHNFSDCWLYSSISLLNDRQRYLFL